jgi:DNA-binding transcriptional MocR family regulator
VAFQMVDLLGANPFLTARGAQQRLRMAYNTIMRAIGQLEKHGIVKEVSGAKRDRVYCARKLLQVFEEPPQIKPVSNSWENGTRAPPTWSAFCNNSECRSENLSRMVADLYLADYLQPRQELSTRLTVGIFPIPPPSEQKRVQE